tara:strand:+ start:176 stop:331 length:156 start_codon:yes stop_codon:yes gene_type:complete
MTEQTLPTNKYLRGSQTIDKFLAINQSINESIGENAALDTLTPSAFTAKFD